MIRGNFERDLQRLQDRMLALGSKVEENIVEAVDLLFKRDMIGSQRLIKGDEAVNQERISIVSDALLLIATQQPMARDMRLIASIIEIVGELERINDYSKGIARVGLTLGPEPIPNILSELPVMAAKTRFMLHRAMDSASRRDAKLAQEIPAMDSEVDELFIRIYRNLILCAADDPNMVERSNQLEWVAHNLERAADRVTNICEWTVYNATGVYREMDSEWEAPPA
ncbi:MAG: phosphate signaling complex protein PhoU [Candidatus Promineifilaceae bacterium]